MDGEFRDDAIPLAGTTADALMDELAAHGAGWDFVTLAPALKSRPVLLVTSDDGLAPDNARLAAALRQAGGAVSETHFATDHSYSDHRIALELAVLDWLGKHEDGTEGAEKPCCAGGFGPANTPGKCPTSPKSAISPSSPISTMANPPWPTG